MWYAIEAIAAIIAAVIAFIVGALVSIVGTILVAGIVGGGWWLWTNYDLSFAISEVTPVVSSVAAPDPMVVELALPPGYEAVVEGDGVVVVQ